MISDTVTRAQVSKNLKCVCQKLNGSRPTRGLFSSIRTCQICGGCHLCTLWNGALLIFALIMQFKRDSTLLLHTVFENLLKCRIQHCERSELRFHLDKSLVKMPKMVHFDEFLKMKLAVKQCYQTDNF